MQTLTAKTVFPCYAPEDRAIAQSLAKFLEQGADVRVFLEDGEIHRGGDLLTKAPEALSADIAILLFSRHSWTRRPRSDWEDALLRGPAEAGVPMGFLRCDETSPPKVLGPQFTPRQLRELKRWVRGHLPHPSPPGFEGLAVALADRPGMEMAESAGEAAEFARAFHQDFDAVVTLQCGARSIAALAGELASQLGLRLEGPLDDNLERLRTFCEARRLLIVLEDVPDLVPPELVFGGRCSTLAAPDAMAVEPDEIRQAQATVADACAAWTDVCAAARQARRLLRSAGRLAELYELMQQWHNAAEDEDDRAALDESARELVWVLDGWGRDGEAQAIDYARASRLDHQMMLPF